VSKIQTKDLRGALGMSTRKSRGVSGSLERIPSSRAAGTPPGSGHFSEISGAFASGNIDFDSEAFLYSEQPASAAAVASAVEFRSNAHSVLAEARESGKFEYDLANLNSIGKVQNMAEDITDTILSDHAYSDSNM